MKYIVFYIALLFPVSYLAAQSIRPLIVTIDCSDAPETQEWAEKIAAIAKEQYPHLVTLLDSEGYVPRDSIVIIIRHMDGVGHATGNRIVISVNRVNSRPNDTGIVVHELIHILQAYRFRGHPGWVTEGIADYLRFFYYERNGDRTCRVNPEKAKYTDSYRVTAAFFDWIVRTHDAGFIKRLNAACREGKYSDEFFVRSTGKTVDELWDDFIRSLKSEVTIVAFGTQRRESVVSSGENVRVVQIPSSSLTAALTNRISGLISYQTGGVPGVDNADFSIRGVTTFGNKSEPLILIDGSEATSIDLARLQPDEIDSFSVMKDATATSLYGERGANGIIIIKTKQGRDDERARKNQQECEHSNEKHEKCLH